MARPEHQAPELVLRKSESDAAFFRILFVTVEEDIDRAILVADPSTPAAFDPPAQQVVGSDQPLGAADARTSTQAVSIRALGSFCADRYGAEDATFQFSDWQPAFHCAFTASTFIFVPFDLDLTPAGSFTATSVLNRVNQCGDRPAELPRHLFLEAKYGNVLSSPERTSNFFHAVQRQLDANCKIIAEHIERQRHG